MKRSNAPIFWLLFGAGGMLSALLGTALVLITGLLVAGLISPRVGSAIDRRGGRLILAASAACLGAGQVVLAVSPNLAVFILGWLIAGVGMGAGLYDAAFSTLGRLYGVRARTLITGLTLFGGLASTVCWPISAFLLGEFGWRGTCAASPCRRS